MRVLTRHHFTSPRNTWNRGDAPARYHVRKRRDTRTRRAYVARLILSRRSMRSPRRITLLLLPLILLTPLQLLAQSRAQRPVSDLELGVDASIRPGDDFFGYANGEWLQRT